MRKPGLLARFSLLSLLATALLGVALGTTLRSRIRERAIADATDSALLVAHFGIQSQLSYEDLESGLNPASATLLDNLFISGYANGSIVYIGLENAKGKLIYSNDPGRAPLTLAHHSIRAALRGHTTARVVHQLDDKGSDQALIEAHAPLRLGGPDSAPDGVFDIYTSYAPVAAAIRSDSRKLYEVLALGLLGFYSILFPIVLGASRRLRRQADENQRQARHDALTGLPNRTWFCEQAEALLTRGRGPGWSAVMVMGIDRFKEVNDTLGHHGGDLLLQAVAERIRCAIRDSDLVSRQGGDEFAVLLPGGSAEAAMHAAERVREALEQRFRVGGATVDIETSIGIALFPEHADDVDTLLQRADLAMYKAKEQHTGIGFYSPELDQGHPSKLSLLGELRRALEREELILHYQPTAALDSGEVTQVEALVRWQRPEHGLVPPGDFIPLAESTGLIKHISAYVLDAALRQLRAWLDAGLDLSVAVNLSARNLLESDLPDQIANLLLQRRVPAERLVLEITESTIMQDPQNALGVLTRLSEMGVRLAIDDFGVGYSSLSYLKRLPVDEIKIDRSFIANMDCEEDDAFIVRSTIDLGRNLGMDVVAEGVETQAVWDELSALGCDYAQGWFLGRPMPAAELAGWLRSQTAARGLA